MSQFRDPLARLRRPEPEESEPAPPPDANPPGFILLDILDEKRRVANMLHADEIDWWFR